MRAVAHAMQVSLDEVAPGMWTATKDAGEYSKLDVTVRTLEVEGGTSVEILLEHRASTKGVTLFTLGIALGCVLLAPLIPTLLVMARVQRQDARQRLLEMHRAWTEIGRAMGAPIPAGYRSGPRRIYVPSEAPAARIALQPVANERSGEREVLADLETPAPIAATSRGAGRV